MFEHIRSFGSKCTVLKKVLATLLGLFGAPRSGLAPHSDSAPGEFYAPLSPILTPLACFLSVCDLKGGV